MKFEDFTAEDLEFLKDSMGLKEPRAFKCKCGDVVVACQIANKTAHSYPLCELYKGVMKEMDAHVQDVVQLSTGGKES